MVTLFNFLWKGTLVVGVFMVVPSLFTGDVVTIGLSVGRTLGLILIVGLPSWLLAKRWKVKGD